MKKNKSKKMTEKEKWSLCEKCGDYEYCGGHYGEEQCTGFIPGNSL